MKICVLQGSPRANGNTAELAKPFVEELRNGGAEVETVFVPGLDVHPCLGCYACQDVQGEYGCMQKDDMQALVDRLVAAQCVVIATPIYIWYCPSGLKAVLDRFFGMNKYYRSATGSLWQKQGLALLLTYGYDIGKGAGPFIQGMRTFARHAGLRYLGEHGVRDINDKPDFQTSEAIEGARGFAREVLGKI